MNKAQNPKPRRRTALLRGAAAPLACLLVAAAWAANHSAKQAPAQQAAGRAHVAAAGARSEAAIPGPAQASTASSYDVVATRNLFMPPESRRSEQPPASPLLEPMPVDAFAPLESGNAEAQPAQPQWVYSGYATINGSPMAIVENSDTKRAEFLSVGQALDGFVVSEVTPAEVKLARDGETKALPISEAFTATPLNEPPKPQQASQGGRGRGGMGAFLNSELYQRVIAPAIQSNPQYADEAQQLMGAFTGGGRGGRGWFGGGPGGSPFGGRQGGPGGNGGGQGGSQ